MPKARRVSVARRNQPAPKSLSSVRFLRGTCQTRFLITITNDDRIRNASCRSVKKSDIQIDVRAPVARCGPEPEDLAAGLLSGG